MALSQEKFQLDKFQLESVEQIKAGKSVLTCAPTGAGKTVIAREAIRIALAENKRVFYTAPLKALINQKFYEFSEEFGKDNVGIVTGDANQNRDAKIIVMTTEIYRNMLYGTSFGSIDPFLNDLKYVIFDEFHFINDEYRGTVWEESVIYTPKSVQMIALSATISNPQELVDWITKIHSECALVETFERPVPLSHYYFKEEQLSPLLTTNNKLNPQLKERNDNRFGSKKGRFGNRFGGGANSKSSIAKVVEELSKKAMLPAIYFVFSRKGCDKAADDCSDLNLLNNEESKKLEQEIALAISENKALEKYNKLHLLKKGIAAHHAGLLPQMKTLIEELFAKGLIKVVFSTETLAAGINMPAKTTVINNLSKATDEGFRTLKASEFLQMSGRAGRRGLDDSGFVVTVKNGNYSAGEVALLAVAKPEDITSHFKASYEMVLNLLMGHSPEELKELVKKSFGQYLAEGNLESDRQEIRRLEDQIMDLQHPLCPGEIGDLNHYRDLQSKLDDTRREKKALEKKLDPAAQDLETVVEMLTMEAKGYPCNGCPKQKPCSKQMDKVKRYRKQVRKIKDRIEDIKNWSWENFEKVMDLLIEERFIENDKPTKKGEICASLRTENSFFITELLSSGVFDGTSPEDFAALLSTFVVGEARNRDKNFSDQAEITFKKEKSYKNIARRTVQKQRNFGIERHVAINPNLSNMVRLWTQNKSWEELMEKSILDDGDVLRALRRTLDLSKQIAHAPHLDKALQATASEAARLIERDIVVEAMPY
jgi:superfamily II RNA helicase